MISGDLLAMNVLSDPLSEIVPSFLRSSMLWTAVVVLAEVCALMSLINVIMRARTAAGAWGWGLALISFPFLAVPLYWVFGRRNFKGYRETLREGRTRHRNLAEHIREALEPHAGCLQGEQMRYGGVLETLSERNFTRDNAVELLIDGRETFDAIFSAIDSAVDYILIQFFIIRDDALGLELQRRLIEKSRLGVGVYLIYDEIGSHRLPGSYVAALRESGVRVTGFQSTRGRSNRFQINFRNHRKIVVVDGREAFVGGHNVGDEYLGLSRGFGRWRDTHIRLRGPAVLATQLVFVGDWYWALREVPDLDWRPRFIAPSEGMTVLPLATDPVEELERGTLFFLHTINRASHRLWIASPYFVPDEAVRAALQLAALKGVDVRIMIPERPDHKTVYLAGFSYLPEMEAAGVRVFRYGAGFLHQKVMLVDDQLASVGTANLDNRSLRLNFELSMVVLDEAFCRRVADMLEADFAECREVDGRDYTGKPLWFRVLVRLARLMAPIL
jgi:cardiolipin synthase